jgi:hypothetical protein
MLVCMWPCSLGPPGHWDGAMGACFGVNDSFCYAAGLEMGLSSVQILFLTSR